MISLKVTIKVTAVFTIFLNGKNRREDGSMLMLPGQFISAEAAADHLKQQKPRFSSS
jgi:hypothetical protein